MNKKLGWLFIIIVALTAHLAFSWIAFSPTDEGWLLAYSKRLLLGQVPHRDFISVKPVGTALFHLGEVAFGGQYTYWFSRGIVWLELATIAWCWILIMKKLSSLFLTKLEMVTLALLAFIFSANTYPPMVWNVTDAIFFITIGLMCCLHDKKWLGYFLMGYAVLCKQNFALILPLSLILLKDWRQWKYWLAGLTAPILYVLYLLYHHALGDAFVQMTSIRSFVKPGVIEYIKSLNFVWGIIGGYTIALWKAKKPKMGAVALFLFALGSIAVLQIGKWHDITHILRFGRFSFLLFGVVLGVFLYKNQNGPLALLALAISWSASISTSMMNPTFGAGLLLTWLLLDHYEISLRTKKWAQVSLCVAAVVSFTLSRYRFTYADHAAGELTYALGDVFPGGKLIWTNPNTYTMLKELKEQMQLAAEKNKSLALISGIPGVWVQSKEINPLDVDWANGCELAVPPLGHSQKILERAIKKLLALKGKTIFLREKYDSYAVPRGKSPLMSSNLPLASVTLEHFTKIGETEYFELYE